MAYRRRLELADCMAEKFNFWDYISFFFPHTQASNAVKALCWGRKKRRNQAFLAFLLLQFYLDKK